MKGARKDRPSRLVVFRAYLVCILVCSFLLFSVSLMSIVRQTDVLRLTPPSALPESDPVRRELWSGGLASVMFVCIMALGVYLLVRVSRDLHWMQVQSNFVSGVSHEFKTPLSLIRLYSETLADEEQSFAPEERRDYIRIIARESERLSRLVDNVLDFSRIRTGQKHLALREGDLADTVEQTVQDYAEYVALRGFTVKTGIARDLPAVRFSSEQISQVVLNLMDNARKYSGRSRLIRVHMWKQGDEIVLEVQDYGIGIPVEEREKIFEPFYRVPRATEKGGVGLGLYLVRDVMHQHGGRIEVHSEVDKGSRFRLFFPVSRSIPEHTGSDQAQTHGRSVVQAG